MDRITLRLSVWGLGCPSSPIPQNAVANTEKHVDVHTGLDCKDRLDLGKIPHPRAEFARVCAPEIFADSGRAYATTFGSCVRQIHSLPASLKNDSKLKGLSRREKREPWLSMRNYKYVLSPIVFRSSIPLGSDLRMVILSAGVAATSVRVTRS
jgi:hypothetical protein